MEIDKFEKLLSLILMLVLLFIALCMMLPDKKVPNCKENLYNITCGENSICLVKDRMLYNVITKEIYCVPHIIKVYKINNTE